MNDSLEKLTQYSIVYEDIDFDDVSLQGVIDLLQSIKDANPGIDLTISPSHSSYTCSFFSVISSRLETDEEYEARHEYIRQEKLKKETKKEMNALMKKDFPTQEEKERLIAYIQGK